MTNIPPESYCTPESITRCGVCGFSFGDHTKPLGRREWCRMLQDTTTCRVIPDHHAIRIDDEPHGTKEEIEGENNS